MNEALVSQPLARALDACGAAAFEGLRGARLFVTGGTGFLGQWVLRGIAMLNANGLGIAAQCSSREPDVFLSRHRGWAGGFDWLRADAAQFSALPLHASTSHILHLATSSDAQQNHADPLGACRTILDGTLGCVQQARRLGAHLQFVSSGAVYGARRASDGPAREDQIGRFGPDPLQPREAYGNAKRMAEALVACGAPDHCITRPFAFLGPGLPLATHFAAGNFVNDAAQGRPIRITGDGTPLRSYMHPADYAAWTLALLAQAPRGEAFNIGSGEPLSIGELARTVSRIAQSPAPQIAGDPSGVTDPSAYWPDVSRAAARGLRLSHTLGDCIEHTLAWARSTASPSQQSQESPVP